MPSPIQRDKLCGHKLRDSSDKRCKYSRGLDLVTLFTNDGLTCDFVPQDEKQQSTHFHVYMNIYIYFEV